MSDANVPSNGEVKMVMAVIRPDKPSDVRAAPTEIGASSLVVTNVSDHGSQPVKKSQWRGEEYTVDLHQRVKIEYVVADIPAGGAVDAIADTAQTGKKSDRKVFTPPIESAVRACTGKTGRDAV